MAKENKKGTLSTKQKVALVVNFIVLLVLYYACIYYGEHNGTLLPYQICASVYVSAALILGAASLVLSGKITSVKLGEERTDKQIALAKTLLLWVMPLFLVLLIDFMDLFVVQYIEQMFSRTK